LSKVVADKSKQDEHFGPPLFLGSTRKIVVGKWISQIGVEAAQDSLMTDDENVLLSFELEDDGFQSAKTRGEVSRAARLEQVQTANSPNDNVAVRLSSSVTVVELVVVASGVVLGVGDLFAAVSERLSRGEVERELTSISS
jgi:hypothetical protein